MNKEIAESGARAKELSQVREISEERPAVVTDSLGGYWVVDKVIVCENSVTMAEVTNGGLIVLGEFIQWVNTESDASTLDDRFSKVWEDIRDLGDFDFSDSGIAAINYQPSWTWRLTEHEGWALLNVSYNDTEDEYELYQWDISKCGNYLSFYSDDCELYILRKDMEEVEK